ncbi:hypothetical protein HDR58_07870 [bacterium]|nr:hypothetical protein [bacterium]
MKHQAGANVKYSRNISNIFHYKSYYLACLSITLAEIHHNLGYLPNRETNAIYKKIPITKTWIPEYWKKTGLLNKNTNQDTIVFINGIFNNKLQIKPTAIHRTKYSNETNID